MKEELDRIFNQLLKEQYLDWQIEKIELKSIMMSWSLYGMSTKYVKSGGMPTEETVRELFEKIMK